jgi:succinate-semialdehyde dehydrogenase/glutarate-semialdehyde dehydrogenase
MDHLAAAEQGKAVGQARRDVLVSYAPATGERLGEVPNLGPDAVSAAVERARTAQVPWALLPTEERCERILQLRDVIVDRAEEIVELLAKECGKPRAEGLTHEVMCTADLATYYAKRAPRLLAPREIELHLLKHRRSYVHYAPRGVVAIIAPWNFPFVIPMGDSIAALLAGNAVVLKPSEITPLIGRKCKELFDASGLPSDLFQVVTGDGLTGAALIDARPDKVVFTGAVSTGRRVAAACGERLIPCTLELGGKAAAIVCEDADLERTARAIVYGGFANSGQICISVERVYAHAALHEKLVERVVELTRELRQGDAASGDVDVGAIIFEKQIGVAETLIADAVEKGARVETGGRKRAGVGHFFEPTVLTGCTQDMAVMRDEIFGPIVPIMRVSSEDEAVRLANDSHLGLMGYVFTRDRDKGRRLAERVRAGTVMVNDVLTAYASPEAPFGGVKDSGYGRVHGEEGLRDMCEVRHVSYDRLALGSRDPMWFPYSEGSYRAFVKGMRLLFRSGSVARKVLDLF